MQDKQISCKGLMRALILALLLMNSTMMFAQNAVTGQVKDQTGEPLIGVSILEQGTNNGTVTDIDGNFRLNVAQGKTLNISYIGYKTQTVRVSGSRLNVVLEEENTNLNEVVVVGYGTMRRKDVTSSITTVKAEDLNFFRRPQRFSFNHTSWCLFTAFRCYVALLCSRWYSWC